jgi:hypothetical protein
MSRFDLNDLFSSLGCPVIMAMSRLDHWAPVFSQSNSCGKYRSLRTILLMPVCWLYVTSDLRDVILFFPRDWTFLHSLPRRVGRLALNLDDSEIIATQEDDSVERVCEGFDRTHHLTLFEVICHGRSDCNVSSGWLSSPPDGNERSFRRLGRALSRCRCSAVSLGQKLSS